MANGNDVFRQAMNLLNYTNVYGETDSMQNADLVKRALPMVNQIYVDLFFAETPDADFVPLRAMQEEIQLSARTVKDIMPYGVAMLFAQSESDGDNQALFATLYNNKRRSAERPAWTVQDVLPSPTL